MDIIQKLLIQRLGHLGIVSQDNSSSLQTRLDNLQSWKCQWRPN